MHFKTVDSFSRFQVAVGRKRRWIFDDETNAFLDAVKVTMKNRIQTLKAGSHLWRAQLGCKRDASPDEDRPLHIPFDQKRMIPDAQLIKNGGRANPPRFAYFYLATNPRTAMSEMRPSMNEKISLALFDTTRDLRLVNCRKSESFDAVFELEPTPQQVEDWVWGQIAEGFSRPIHPDDQSVEYVPTQILAELFKAEGYDGIEYPSGLSQEGQNIVLFDVDTVIFRKPYLYELDQVKYTFKADPLQAIHVVDGENALQLWCELNACSPERWPV